SKRSPLISNLISVPMEALLACESAPTSSRARMSTAGGRDRLETEGCTSNSMLRVNPPALLVDSDHASQLIRVREFSLAQRHNPGGAPRLNWPAYAPSIRITSSVSR